MVLFHFQYLYGGQSKFTWNIITGYKTLVNLFHPKLLQQSAVYLYWTFWTFGAVGDDGDDDDDGGGGGGGGGGVCACVRTCVRAKFKSSQSAGKQTVASLTGKISILPLCLLWRGEQWLSGYMPRCLPRGLPAGEMSTWTIAARRERKRQNV